jgi:outer membrane protein TolC
MRPGRFLLMLAAASHLAACATYQARPLTGAAATHAQLADLKVDVAALRLEPLKPIRIDPADGLTPREIAVLAVLNDPDLAAKRAARGVAQAQVFAAGLLPNPQIAVSADRPVAGPDHVDAYSVSPSLDLAALIARSAVRSAARQTSRQGDLDLLWAEWGIAQQARQQALTALSAQARQQGLGAVLAAASERLDRSRRALAAGDATLQTTSADLAAKLDAESALATAQDDEAKARATLNGLLNLDLAVRLPLAADPDDQAYDPAVVRRALTDLPARRPDLLALRAGYGAQEANLHAAVLNAFPLTQIALAFARDTAGAVTQGLAASFALPVFNGSKGAIAIQTATRAQLAAEYQARIDQAQGEVQAAQGELARAQGRARNLSADLPAAEAALKPAQAAFDRGDLDSQAFLGLRTAVLTRRAELDDARLQAGLAEIRLETLLFLPPTNSRSQP